MKNERKAQIKKTIPKIITIKMSQQKSKIGQSYVYSSYVDILMNSILQIYKQLGSQTIK